MKILRSWLLELCDLDHVPTADELSRTLTGIGLEVDAMTDLGAGFSGVVVAEVVAVRPHPSADKLRLVDVVTAPGGAATQVVCGAPNVPAPGGRVLWAQPGARLPGGITLAVKPVKGVDSPGMLCAEDELGIGDDEAGIIVLADDDPTPLGAPAQQALGVDDWRLELGIPANRPDLLGHLGVARELVARLGGRLVPPNAALDEFLLAGAGVETRLGAAIDDATGCARYTARAIDGLRVGRSPRRLAQRLRSVGVRPISNLVDVTNYVLFELGQPLHAFDGARLDGGRLAVRAARDGERLATLDGQDRALVAGDLLIVDGARGERPVALAGVMGGATTEVHAGTTQVVLESAAFAPKRIRATARRLGLTSESSLRFERGVDPDGAAFASARAAGLLARLGGGRVVPGLLDAYARPPTRTRVRLRHARLDALTGVAFAPGVAAQTLTRLGCDVLGDDGAALEVAPPTWRSDLGREADLIEDVLRLTGYEHVPVAFPPLPAANPLAGPPTIADVARQSLAAAGLAETLTYGFQSFARLEALQLPATDRRARPIALRNPMSAEQAILRTSLLPNLLAAAARNASRGERDLAVFEVGPVFLRRDSFGAEVPPHELADEDPWATALFVGHRPAHLGAPAAWDLFDAKGVLDRLAAALGVELRYTPARDVPYLHPGLAARIWVGEAEVGTLGEVHPDVRAALGVDAPGFSFELRLAGLPAPEPRAMRPIPRFPASTRDVSLLFDDRVPADRIHDVITEARVPLLERARIAEVYRDDRMPAGQRSVLVALSYRSLERTLTDAEVDAAHEALVARLVEAVPAQRR